MSDRPRFPLFDSLRAIAALSIFGFHIAASQLALNDPDFPWLGQLNVGVPIFFVVSGFLLYRPFVARRAQGRPAPSLGGYAIRRALRIIPAYWVALTVITVWLGLVAQLGGVAGTSAPVPNQLAVVQVQAGETLQQVARRVAPDAPVGQVVDRIRELNQLGSAALDAGQTLIAPVG